MTYEALEEIEPYALEVIEGSNPNANGNMVNYNGKPRQDVIELNGVLERKRTADYHNL